MSTKHLVSTRILILSDTHGSNNIDIDSTFDLVIHCGDLTEESKIEEFRSTLELLRKLPAHTKIVVAGNHDITLEEGTFLRHLRTAGVEPTDPAAVKAYGHLGEARTLLQAAKDDGIHFLEEGLHILDLASNGARVSVYVNPKTPRRKSEGALGSGEAGWAYQYDSAASSPDRFTPYGHADIFVTHGPPEGVLDYVDRQRAGCPDLFAAVAAARPQLHCFGHIHAGWGAKLVTWRDNDKESEKPTHFTAIDNDASSVLAKLSLLKPGKFDSDESKAEKRDKLEKMLGQGYCPLESEQVTKGSQTLFVNAAVEGDTEMPVQPPISVTLKLPSGSEEVQEQA